MKASWTALKSIYFRFNISVAVALRLAFTEYHTIGVFLDSNSILAQLVKLANWVQLAQLDQIDIISSIG